MSWRNALETVRDVLKTELVEVAGTSVTLATLLTAFAMVFAAAMISRLLRRGVQRTFRARGVEDPGTRAVVEKLLHYLIMLIGVGIALQTLGIDLGTLFAAGAVFAVGIGFAMQTVVQNFVSGIILMLERSITPEDILEVDGMIVRVKRMGIRSTVAVSLDGEDLLLPNSTIVQNTVKNLTLDLTEVRVNVSVGVAYESDVDLVIETLEAVARELHDDTASSSPLVFFREFGDSALIFDIALWTRDPWTIRRLRSRVHVAIWRALKEKDIVVAFPQIDVHFDEGVKLAS